MAGSFDITFDPTKPYPPTLGGFISHLSYSVTDPYFSPLPLTFKPIVQFAFDRNGTLTLYSNPGVGKSPVGTDDIAIGINGWGIGRGADIWYSQPGFADTLTSSGTATISAVTPLPSTWTMLIAGFVGLGIFGYRGARKGSSAFAAA